MSSFNDCGKRRYREFVPATLFRLPNGDGPSESATGDAGLVGFASPAEVTAEIQFPRGAVSLEKVEILISGGPQTQYDIAVDSIKAGGTYAHATYGTYQDVSPGGGTLGKCTLVNRGSVVVTDDFLRIVVSKGAGAASNFYGVFLSWWQNDKVSRF
jgi:hypothetical protein